MAISSIISPKELRRIAVRSYEGKTLWVRLCNIVSETYDANTSVSLWRNVELPATAGYLPYSHTIEPGTYSATNGRWELPSIDAAFNAVSSVFSYNRVLLYIDDYVIETASAYILTATNISFQASTNTITQTTGDFTTKFEANGYIKVTNSTGDDGIYEIANVSALSMTLSSRTPLPLSIASGPSVTLTKASLYPYAIITEDPNITLVAGQTQTYRVDLNTDDG